MAFVKDVSSVVCQKDLGLWRVELEGLNLPHETNITVGEVVAKNRLEAEEIVLNKPYFNGRTPKDLGARVKNSTLVLVIGSGSLFRWRGNTGGFKSG